MKKFKHKIKTILLFVFWMACGSSLLLLLSAAIKKQAAQKFSSITVNMEDDNGIMFITEAEVIQMLRDNQVNQGLAKPVSEINFYRIEQLLESNPFVEHAEVFTDANERIIISIKQRMPLLRIINSQSVSYYIDDHGRRMPLSANFTARVPVATGFIFTNAEHQSKVDSLLENKIFVLADFIRRDTFLSSLTEQIIVNRNEEFELVPLMGGFVIQIGDTSELERKFRQIKIFYRETVSRVDLNEYSQINVKYAGKVYCTKRVNGNFIDRAKENNSITDKQ